MTGVDNRIVSMQFDNKAFESRMAETLSSLEKLRASLQLSGATQGFQEIQAASNRMDMGPIGVAVDGISTKFLTLSTIAITALSNITNKAVDTGIKIGKALSLDGIMDGFREYEINMNSIQTILSNTKADGTNLEQVNSALDRLNEYSDLTIYNFAEMARNIGTFTAAGVDLETSVGSIKGIANLAAISGSNSQQAATAMYQLSQAIASGTVKLMDWNSVVNAGMGGEVFQRALFETGKALGQITNVPVGATFEEWIKVTGSFRESLSKSQKDVGALAEAQKENARAIRNAEESAAEAIVAAKKRVQSANENLAKTTESTSKNIAAAAEAQIQTQERAAKSLKKAFEDTLTAYEALQKALEPASQDDLEAANDRLRLSQLDQADLAYSIGDAQKKQEQAAKNLAAAQERLAKVEASPSASEATRLKALEAVAEAERKVVEVSDEVERAQIAQNNAARRVTQTEKELAEVKKKGTEQDEQVIRARTRLTELQEAYARTQTETQESIIQAEERVAEVAKVSAEQRKNAIEQLNEAQRNSVKVTRNSQESVAAAHEAAAKRIEALTKTEEPPGWLSSDVLTTTLKALSGDLDKAGLMALGYTEAQADAMFELGQTGIEAASVVKTITQLIGTLKETVGSGWSQSFRTIFGNFDEAKSVFSSISNFLGQIAGNSALTRNELLNGWKELGGRDVLIQGLMQSFALLEEATRPVREAFRTIFPPMTAERLYAITAAVRDFIGSLRPSKTAMRQLEVIFTAVFAAVEIGITVFKEIGKTVAAFFGSITGGTGNTALQFFANLSTSIITLNSSLVGGGGIADFFGKIQTAITNFGDSLNINGAISKVIETLGRFKDAISSIFSDETTFESPVVLDGLLDRLGERFSWLGGIVDFTREAFVRIGDTMSSVGNVVSGFADKVKEELGNLWDKVGESFGPGSYDKLLDGVNIGLLGGILLLLRKFVSDGVSIDFGGGLLEGVKDSLEALTNHLTAMQTQVKAQALFDIGKAIALLTASVVVLSLIDSSKLTKALTALAVGFGQLIAALALLGPLNSGIRFPILTAGLIGLTTAILILSLAVRSMAGLGWEELTKGLLGISVSLGALVGAIKLLGKPAKGLIPASVGMIAIGVSLNVVALAVRQFSNLSWEEMGKGLAGVAGSLLAIVLAMKKMPVSGMLGASVGMIAIGTALNIIALSVKQFGSMDLASIGKGLLGIGATLGIIVIAVNAIKYADTLSAGAGLLLISGALFIMSKAVQVLGGMSWGDMVKGLVGVAALLTAMAVAANAMSASIPGAIAIVIISGSLWVLAGVLVALAQLSWGDLIKGLVAIAGVLTILGVAASLITPAIPSLLGLGVALVLLAGSFLIFGAGLGFVAKAFELFAKFGREGLKYFKEALDVIVESIPKLIFGILQGMVAGIIAIGEKIPEIVDVIVQFGVALLEGLVELIPKVGEVTRALIDEIVKIVGEKSGPLIDAGLTLLTNLLTGIDENIEEITKTVAGIIIKFLTALTEKIQFIVDAGAAFLAKFISGIAENFWLISGAVSSLIEEFIIAISEQIQTIITAGKNLIIDFIKGIGKASIEIADAGAETVVKFLRAMNANIQKVIDAGWEFIIQLIRGVRESIDENAPILREEGKRLVYAIVNGFSGGLLEKAGEIKDNLTKPFTDAWESVKSVFSVFSPSKESYWLAEMVVAGFANGMSDNTRTASNSAKTFGTEVLDTLRNSLTSASAAIVKMEEFNPTITPVLDLSKVRTEASKVGALLSVKDLSPSLSYAQASSLSGKVDSSVSAQEPVVVEVTKEVTFKQENHSPEALSTGDIYRNTNSQISLLKQELGVP